MGDKVDINKTCDAKSPNAEKTGRLTRRNRSSNFDETLNKAEYDSEKREQELGNKQRNILNFK